MGEIELRPPCDEDVPRLVEIANDCLAVIDEPPVVVPTDVTFEWGSPGFDRERDARVAVLDGRLVGSTSIHARAHEVSIDGGVHPAARGRGVGSALFAWALAAARARPETREIYVGAPTSLPDAIGLIEAQDGFIYVRSFYNMKHRTPGAVGAPRWPDGISLERLRGTALVDATTEAYDGSFVDHWGYTPARSDDYLHEIENDPDNDPELWMIAAAGERIAGFCLCYLEGTGDDRCGTVWQLGTTRPFRGIGLGRALLLEGVRRLAERGARVVELGVDAENPTGALQLYRSVGFQVARESRAYVLRL